MAKYQVYDPVSDSSITVRGQDNAAQARIQFMTNAANLNLAKQQNDWNLARWEDEKAYNKEMWDLSNQYNSPENQLKLLQQAGFNPNSFSGQGFTSAPLSTSAPESTDLSVLGAPQLSPANDVDRILKFVDGLKGVADSTIGTLTQIYQQKNLQAGIAEAEARTRNANLEGEYLGIRNQYAPNTFATDLKSKESNIHHLWMQDTKLQNDIDIANKQFDLAEKRFNVDRDKILADIRSINVNTNIAKWKHDFMKKYNMDPDSDWLQNLINIALSSPAQFDMIASRLIGNVKHMFSPPSWKNLLGL